MRISDSKVIEELTDFASKNHKHAKELTAVLFEVIMRVRKIF